MYLDGLDILLAEDNHTNRVVAQQMLESIRARVVLAVDGAEALDKLAEQRFDVLLVDIEMPRVSGLDVIRRLSTQKDPPRDGLTVIALTAYATPSHREEILALGADGVITKPIVSIEQLGTEIRACLDGASARRNSRAEPAEIDREIYDGLTSAVGPAAMDDLLSKVDADIADAYDRMVKAIAGNDMAELRAATHVIIAVAGAIGAVGLQALGERLHRAAQTPDPDAIATLGPAAMAEADRVRGFVAAERAG